MSSMPMSAIVEGGRKWSGSIGSRLACVAAFAVLAPGTPLIAQARFASWSGQASDNGSLIFGFAALSDYSLSIHCSAPSPQGLPLMQTGSHESHQAEPFELFIGFSDFLFDWQPPFWQTGALMMVGEFPFAMPDFELNELQGTAVRLPMSAPFVQALYTASSLALVTPEGMVHRFSVEGLVPALETALSACIERWVAMGHAIPAGLTRSPAATDQSGALQPAPDASKSPDASTGIAGLPSVIVAHVRQMCGGQARIEDAALRVVDDFDADGAPDYVIHYADVYCQPGDVQGFCGAANCSIDVFLSSLGYARAFEFLAIAVEPISDAKGRRGLQMHATAFMCSDGACDGVWLWNGETFSNE